jgi:hypothetical protein
MAEACGISMAGRWFGWKMDGWTLEKRLPCVIAIPQHYVVILSIRVDESHVRWWDPADGTYRIAGMNEFLQYTATTPSTAYYKKPPPPPAYLGFTPHF